MKYLDLNLIKKHLNMNADYTAEDDYLTMLGGAVEEVVEKHIDDDLNTLAKNNNDQLPLPLVQACLLLLGTYYSNRENVAFTGCNEIPTSFTYLLDLYKNYGGSETNSLIEELSNKVNELIQYMEYDKNRTITGKNGIDTVGFDTPTSVPYKDDSNLGLYSTNGFVGYTDNTLTNKVIDFSKTTVRNNAHYYPVFKEINVYDNIDPSYYSGEIYITEDGKTGVELTLIKAVKGKITIPATFNLDGVNYPVLSINASFAASKNGLTSHIPRGQNLTHVFFALDTQIEVFNMYAFFGDSIYTTVSKLVYVEFPDSLKTIGQDCFARCGSLDYSIVKNDPNARISGAGLKDIGDRAFIVAFKAQDIGQLNIGGGITTIGRRAFYNMNITYSQINIGSTDNYSNLGISLTNTEAKFNNADTVWFYSNNYDASDVDTLLPYFGNPANLHVI